MAQVRDFNSYKKQKTKERIQGGAPAQEKQARERAASQPESAKAPTEEEARKAKSRKMMLRALAVLAVIALLSVIAFFAWRDKVYTQMRVAESVGITDTIDATCVNLNGYVLQYSRDGMNCMNSKGEVIWNRTYEMQAPVAEVCGGVAAIGDFNGRTIYVVDTTAPLGEIHTNLPIRGFHVASQGVVAVILDDANVTWINLYDAEGNELAGFRTSMSDSGYPFSVAISPNGLLVCVSFLSYEGTTAKTTLAFYNFGPVGQNHTDKLVSGFNYDDAIVPYVRFFDDAHGYAVSTDRILFFEGDQMPQVTKQTFLGTEEIRSVYDSTDYVGIVFSGGSDEGAFRLQVYDKKGNEQFVRYLDHEYENIVFGDRQVILYDADQWRIIGMDGEDKYEAPFDYSVKVVIPTTVRGRFLLIGSERIQTVELK